MIEILVTVRVMQRAYNVDVYGTEALVDIIGLALFELHTIYEYVRLYSNELRPDSNRVHILSNKLRNSALCCAVTNWRLYE